MKTFKEIEDFISGYSQEIEDKLSLSEITIKHGLHSFRYGSSSFLSELFNPLQLQKGNVFYDLGSGYGTIILYGALEYPGIQFKGIELLEERNSVCEAIITKAGLANISAICGDILEADISDGDVFYLYNPLFDFQYLSLLDKLYQISLQKPITVIAESNCDFFDEAGWLKLYHASDIDIIRTIKYYRS